MATDGTRIFDNALALADDERAALAYRLLQSLKPPGVITEDKSSFVDELQRRSAAYDAGHTTADDWDAVSQRLRTALDAERSS